MSVKRGQAQWFKGKGTIGKCWELDRPVYKYWLPIALRHGNGNLTPQTFARISKDAKMEMSREEFVSIVDKYAEILAVPVKNHEGQIVGVLSVDLARKNRTLHDGQALSTPDVEGFVTTAAAVIHQRRLGR
jgi:hypothetical protein